MDLNAITPIVGAAVALSGAGILFSFAGALANERSAPSNAAGVNLFGITRAMRTNSCGPLTPAA